MPETNKAQMIGVIVIQLRGENCDHYRYWSLSVWNHTCGVISLTVLQWPSFRVEYSCRPHVALGLSHVHQAQAAPLPENQGTERADAWWWSSDSCCESRDREGSIHPLEEKLLCKKILLPLEHQKGEDNWRIGKISRKYPNNSQTT